MNRLVEAFSQPRSPFRGKSDFDLKPLPEELNYSVISSLHDRLRYQEGEAILLYYCHLFTHGGHRLPTQEERSMLHLLVLEDCYPELKNGIWKTPEKGTLKPQLVEDLLNHAFEYLSPPIRKIIIADIFEKFTIPNSKHKAVELFYLYLDRLTTNTPVFDPSVMELDHGGRPYIGGLPLFDSAGCYIFSLNYQGLITGRSGTQYEVVTDGEKVEIKRKGRRGQQTDEPGYFKIKMEELCAEGIVVTKVPGKSNRRDPDLYFGRLFQHLIDTYPFARGPVTSFKGEWRSGDNYDAYESSTEELSNLTRLLTSKRHSYSQIVDQLVSHYSTGTPIHMVDSRVLQNELIGIVNENIESRRKYIDKTFSLSEGKITSDAIEILIKMISAWKTNNGQVLYRRLGFDSVNVTGPYPIFSRNSSEILRRERALSLARQRK